MYYGYDRYLKIYKREKNHRLVGVYKRLGSTTDVNARSVTFKP